MIQSDGAMVDFAGFKNVLSLLEGGKGRDVYSSSVGNIMIAVISNVVYSISPGIAPTFIGNLVTTSGPVYISENNNGEIAITDGINLYVYNYINPTSPALQTFSSETLEFTPGYITFQNSRLVVADVGTNNWALSDLNDATSWPNDAQHRGKLQTKPDHVVGALRFPGRGNLLFVFGKTVTEPWNDVGAALFPYTRLDSFNVDYGCLSADTIAENENIVVWLAANEQSGPAIMYSSGLDIKKISTDGIDYKLSTLTAPQDSYGFLYRQDGHLIYQITFTTDNLSYIYDFNTNLFFNVSDENLNYHPAKRVVFFNNKYYFISFNDGNLYEFGTQFTNFEYSSTNIQEIPRIIMTKPSRLPNSRWWIARSITFTIEQGQQNTITDTVFERTPFIGNDISTENLISITTENGIQLCTEQNLNITVVENSNMAVDLSISRDGAETFGSSWRQNMNPTGVRKSRFQYLRLGIINDSTYQLRFYGFSRFVVFDGVMEIYQ